MSESRASNRPPHQGVFLEPSAGDAVAIGKTASRQVSRMDAEQRRRLKKKLENGMPGEWNWQPITMEHQAARAGAPRLAPFEPYVSQLEGREIPGFEGAEQGIFWIHGNNMRPTVLAYDHLICHPLKTIGDLPEGALAVVIIQDEMMLKRVFFQSGKVVLQNDNPAFRSLEVAPEMFDEVWQVLGRITRVLDAEKPARENYLSDLQEEMREVRANFEKIKKDFKKMGLVIEKGR